MSGGSGTTGRAEDVGDGTAIGERTGSVESISRLGSWTPVPSGMDLGRCEGRRTGTADGVVTGEAVGRRDGITEGFGEAGLEVADLVGRGVTVGAVLLLGAGEA
ncbi:hypothetical protein, partial [Streptosporangium sp. NPDC023615]|uniref:hypothetical protein n=1 Tax=Streptosporangium sp. NPDC023615 TaxID=3154794 RepID=UPI003423C16A